MSRSDAHRRDLGWRRESPAHSTRTPSKRLQREAVAYTGSDVPSVREGKRHGEDSGGIEPRRTAWYVSVVACGRAWVYWK